MTASVHRILLGISIALGLTIAYVDSRPTWDDTGITALALFLSSGLLGAFGPDRPWLWALGVGLWIPIYAVASSRNYGSLLALVPAFAGAYAGMGLRRVFVDATRE